MKQGGVAMGMFLSAGGLFGVATAAYEEARDTVEEGVAHRASLNAIVFSAIALEAFINEVAEYAAMSATDGSPAIGNFAALAREVEEAHGSIRLKFLLASAVLGGRAYDRGIQPYQDFALLVAVRNAIVHHKPEDRIQGQEEDEEIGNSVVPRKLTEQLRGRHLIEVNLINQASFLQLIATPKMAAWACDTAANMVRSLVDTFPASSFKRSMQFQTRPFQPMQRVRSPQEPTDD